MGHNLKRIIQLTSGRMWMGKDENVAFVLEVDEFLSCKHVEISDFWGKPPPHTATSYARISTRNDELDLATEKRTLR